MRAKQSILGLVYSGGEVRRPPLIGMQFLHERAMGASDVVAARPRLQAKDLIGLLRRHFATRRRAALPPCPVALRVLDARRESGGPDSFQVRPRFRHRRTAPSPAGRRGRTRRARDRHARPPGSFPTSARCRDRGSCRGIASAPSSSVPTSAARRRTGRRCLEKPGMPNGDQPSRPAPKIPSGMATTSSPRSPV